MAHMNLHQDRFQGIQDFRDQYIDMKKIYSKLGLSFGRCEEGVRAVLKEEGV